MVKYLSFYLCTERRKKQNEAKPLVCFLTHLPTSLRSPWRLCDNVYGARRLWHSKWLVISKSRWHTTINPSPEKHFPVSCCTESSLSSLKSPKRICKDSESAYLGIKAPGEPIMAHSKMQESVERSVRVPAGDSRILHVYFKHIYIFMATCSLIHLSPLYLSGFTG